MMKSDDFILPSVQADHLKTINEIHFTPKEVGVLACIMSGRSAKKTAILLSIVPKTVESHVRNIMSKIGCNSRENIRDFIEKSDKFELIKAYYRNLVVQSSFQQILKKISVQLGEKPLSYLVFYDQHLKDKANKFNQLKANLKLAGFKEFSLNECNEFHATPVEDKKMGSITFVLQDDLTSTEISRSRVELDCINFSSYVNYYNSILDLIKKILTNSKQLPNINIDRMISDIRS